MKELTDEELMARCASGDRTAMDLLVSRYHAKLIDFAFRYIKDRETSADIAQTTLIRVFQSAATYRSKSSFRAWLYTIALNRIRDEFRKRRSRNETSSSDLEVAEMMESQAMPEQTLEENVVEHVYASQVWQSVNELPEDQQFALTLRFRHDLTYEEIAQVMGVSSGTVKSWVHYALKKLRKSFQPANCEG